MYIIDVLLLVIKREGNKGLKGRTLLQKKVYFSSALMRVNLDFSPHHYGPYSSLVAGHLSSLVSHGFLNEQTEGLSPNSTNGRRSGEMYPYIYTLTKEGDEVWREIKKEPDFDEWQNKLNLINKQPISRDSKKLSIAAKVHYIVNWRGQSTKVEEVKRVAEKYGWDMKDGDIESVSSFLTTLDLLTIEEF